MTYYSEHGQDRWLANGLFKGKRNGIFVEFGALDGLLHSNSLYFEREMGWRGLLAEANPLHWDALRRNRPHDQKLGVAIAGHNGEAEFAIVPEVTGWSGLAAEMEPQHRSRIAQRTSQNMVMARVPCMTLAGALKQSRIKVVDYLSIDVEGAEWDILSGFPFGSFEIDVIGVEDNFGNFPLDRLMAENGYNKLARIGVDNFYRRQAA